MNEREKVKGKIDKVLSKKPEEPKEEKPKEEDKPIIWTPFARKIYTDIKLYKEKLGDAQPTRAVATKFRADIEDKLENGKEKDSIIKYYNKQFKLPGVSSLPWNYFAESVIDPKEKEKGEEKLLRGVEEIIKQGFMKGYTDDDGVREITLRVMSFIKNVDKKESILENEKTYILKHTNVDGNSVWNKWNKKPTKEQLENFFSAYYDTKERSKIVQDLLLHGSADLNDRSSTTFELTTI